MESGVRIHNIGAHPVARVNCLNLLPHGVMTTHRKTQQSSFDKTPMLPMLGHRHRLSAGRL